MGDEFNFKLLELDDYLYRNIFYKMNEDNDGRLHITAQQNMWNVDTLIKEAYRGQIQN